MPSTPAEPRDDREVSLPVFLGPVSGAQVGDDVVVEGDEARHAVVVRRIRVGEQVVLVDGAGVSATCAVTATSKSALQASVLSVSESARPTPAVTVVQAIPKGDRAELAVEVLTEIGVDRIVPWAAARSVGVWRGERATKSLAKWRSTAREAGKQSRRSWLPEVTEMATTADVVSLVEAADLAVVLHESASAAAGRPDARRRRLRPGGGRSRGRDQRRGAGRVRRRARRTDGRAGAAHLHCRGRRRGSAVVPDELAGAERSQSGQLASGSSPPRNPSTFSAGISHGRSTPPPPTS